MIRCPECNRELHVGDWPYCPHGPAGHSIETNESFIGGVVLENMGHDPVTVYSREQFRDEMRARGLEQRIKYVPGDKHLTNWALAIDAQTLENARILLTRGQSARESLGEEASLPSLRLEHRVVGTDISAPLYPAKR